MRKPVQTFPPSGIPKGLARRRQLEERARLMRASPTWPEQVLWRAISGQRLGPGVCVKRQVVIGRFIADFAVPSARIVIEVDGPCHARQRSADARRDRVLARLGWRVLRVSAADVCRDVEGVVRVLRAALASG
ncbi:MAG TPA: endonuclease domain-containing protein [Polyangiaceae bacterium]|nr:endonuclease domain-containing protein [Polyangiaceae bacterium]